MTLSPDEYLITYKEQYTFYAKLLDLLKEEDVKFFSEIKTQALEDSATVEIKGEKILQDRYLFLNWIVTERIKVSPLGV